MFSYLFPIFCFGLVICGIVFLGFIEADKQAKAELGPEVDATGRPRQSYEN